MQNAEVLTIQGYGSHLTISNFSHLHGTQKTFIMKSLLLPLMLLTFFTHSLLAQVNVTGKVTDVNGQPLFGVTVAEKSTNNGDYTVADGTFNLKVTDANATLVFSYVGLATKEVPLNGQTSLNVTMETGSTELTAVEVVGSRSLNRSATNSPVPVDYLDLRKIANEQGQLDINQMLHYLAPSFNANKQSGSDGADHVDPATLRGLGPDQTLVLVNGKRYHQSSLINIYGTRGRGNTGSDLNSIPISAIDHIEILRDGASALYGSDAIAGVINIVLKKNTGELNASVDGGANIAQYVPGDTSVFDGRRLAIGANYGFGIGEKGYLNLSADYLKTGHTNRAGIPADWWPGHTDVRNQFGQASSDNIGGVLNFAYPFSEKLELYALGMYNYRMTDAFAFTRSANSDRNVISIYPNGFDPIIQSKIGDGQFDAGLKGTLGKWRWDLANALGMNKFHFYGDNTLNASLEEASPTHFDDGGTQLMQNTTTLDFSHYWEDVMNGLTLSLGAEFRYENYQIFAGEEGSWQTYPAIFIDPETGDTSDRPGGSQGFPGFRPDNEVNESRTNAGAYADLSLDITDQFMFDLAVRGENYSDFGATFNGRLATRYAPSDLFAIRGSVSTGFRAPSLAQIYYNQTFTNVQNGVIFDAVIANNVSVVAKALGIPELKEEKAITGSLGFTITPGSGFSATLDGYYVHVDDRIVLTGNFYSDDPDIGEILQQQNVTAAQFFTNAVNTTTWGLDYVINYEAHLNNHDRVVFSLIGNYNKMTVDTVYTNDLLAGKEDSYFGPRDSAFLINSAPPYKATLGLGYISNKYSANIHANFWSGLKFYDYDPKPYEYKSAVTIDISFGLNLTKNLSLHFGALNLFNQYPKWRYDQTAGGSPDAIGYDPYETETGGAWDAVQMGFDGTFLFAKLGIKL
jgi:iron complex outermembrane receptor protein